MREVKERAEAAVFDPIDALVPRPRPLGGRLAFAFAVVGLVGVCAWLFGSGRVYPQLDCCGSSPRTPTMITTRDAAAVQLGVVVTNSSGATLRVDGAAVELADAEVIDVGAVPWGTDVATRMPFEPVPFPASLAGRGETMIVVTFVPTSCEVDVQRNGRPEWGAMTLDLDVVDNGLLPSVGRSYRLPGALVRAGGEPLDILPIGDQPQPATSDPIVAACALLGR